MARYPPRDTNVDRLLAESVEWQQEMSAYLTKIESGLSLLTAEERANLKHTFVDLMNRLERLGKLMNGEDTPPPAASK
jgi:hypothetical protein